MGFWLFLFDIVAVSVALIGLMLGSLRVLWPWPNGVGIIEHDETISGTGLGLPDGAPWVVPILLAAASTIVVVALARFAQPSADEAHRD